MNREGVKYKGHLWNFLLDDAVCALCGESWNRLHSPDHPTGQWWCWDNTFPDYGLEPPDERA